MGLQQLFSFLKTSTLAMQDSKWIFSLTCNGMGLGVSINEFGTQAISMILVEILCKYFLSGLQLTCCHVTLYCRANCVFELNQFWVDLISS